MRVLKGVGIVFGAIVVTIAVILTATIVGGKVQTSHDQSALAAFYETPNPLPAGKPGDIIRQEKMDVPDIPANAEMYRVLYHTEGGDGQPRISSGFVVTPTGPAPKEGRQVLAWAHGTTGMGDACAPSRTEKPLSQLTWISEAIDRGYVVTATDYAGLGTEGPQMYLVGQDEARDVVNSVRAARNLPGTNAGTTYGVVGHSQGGHSSLWTGHEGPKYASELKLVGAAAFAPASELITLVSNQWDKMAAWVIGPEFLVSFKVKYPDLPTDGIVSEKGMNDYEAMAQECINAAAVQAMIDDKMGNQFFVSNPLDNEPWRKALAAESVRPLPASMPAYIAESINDGVVTPASIVKTQEQFCAAKSNLWTDWLGPLNGGMPIKMDPVSHAKEGFVAGPLALNWLYPLYAGKAPIENCATPPAVTENPPWS